ncbi:MAG: glycosyltransferase [Caldilineaceae bacterium]|nr:glycosyltransferase [Caldilineaceae bacterium]MCB0189372.1 glycosyltransferase [Caldilineaceae bacterium]
MQNISSKPNVVVYSDHLLPYSQTFVIQQGEALQTYQAQYVGSRMVNGLALPKNRAFALNRGSWLGKGLELAHKTLHFAPTLSAHLKQLRPMLLHAHFGPGGAFLMPYAQALQLPLVVTFHGFDVTVKDTVARSSFYGHRLFIRRREALKQSASTFIAVSHFIKHKLLAAGFPEEKILVHYIGVKTEEFEPALLQRERMVLFVGRLVEKKGCRYLIQAMAAIQATQPDVELVVIGDGTLRKELEAQAQATLRSYRFLGAQPSNVVKEYMNRAKVFCVPSIVAESGDAEAFGIVFIEAQAMGTPVVSFASGGIPEAVSHGHTGLLAPEKEWRMLADQIAVLLNNEEQWQRYSEAGQHFVRSNFNLANQTRQLEACYDEVVANHFARRDVHYA